MCESHNAGSKSTIEEPVLWGLKPGTWIAVVALVFGSGSLWWQFNDWIFGEQTELLALSQQVVEFRCNKRKSKACYGPDNVGRLTIVVPVFFFNKGAEPYNALIDKVTLRFVANGQKFEFQARDFWRITESGGDAIPFFPIVVDGRRSAGEEIRFTSLAPPHLLWTNFLEWLSSDKPNLIDIDVSAHKYEDNETLTMTCKAMFRDVHFNKAASLLKQEKGRHITTICK